MFRGILTWKNDNDPVNPVSTRQTISNGYYYWGSSTKQNVQYYKIFISYDIHY